MGKNRHANFAYILFSLILVMILISSCSSSAGQTTQSAAPSDTACPGTDCGSTSTANSTSVQASSPTPQAIPNSGSALPTLPAVKPLAGMPKFSHVIIILLENHEYSAVVGNKDQMPVFNQWLDQYASLTNYYAVTHPSLPNYLALIGGSTFDITSDCNGCFINAPSLPDQIEASQRTWKTYQENMPAPCYLGDKNQYSQHHDPFVYFDLIRKNPDRCDNYVVPMTQLDSDLSSGKLPDFSFIVPNICNDAHNCSLSQTDSWLKTVVDQIQASPSYDNNTLIAAIFDEGDTNATCCGLGSSAGGHVAAVLISPLVQSGFQDPTQYSHYSLLKTIEASWGLPYLGHAADEQTKLILAPWKK